jgi:4'-phosphopantetheinyl transferase
MDVSSLVWSRDGLTVWSIPLDLPGERYWRLLAPGERERAAGMPSPVDRRRFVVAHGVIRVVLGRRCGMRPESIVFDTTGGRPRLRRKGTDFSLSRSAGYALLAVTARGRVGVDIQRCDSHVDVLALAESCFRPAEARGVRLRGAAEFFRLWTVKEAYVKACGTGLSGLRDAAVSDGTVASTGERRPGRFWPVPVATGYAAAVVLLDERMPEPPEVA